MENVSYSHTEECLVLQLSGHIDSANASAVEEAIRDICSSHAAKSVRVDCEKLEYISSAGLRILLRLKKTAPDLHVENVSAEVYDVFEMTGFTEMMDIRKAYRILSVDGCEMIGRGANGEVYRIDPDTIVKVYLNPDALPEIQRERELARTAFVLGIPTAIPYDVVRIQGGGYGSVFELLNAQSFSGILAKNEKPVEEVARMSIDLLKQIHETVVKPNSMPNMKEVALDWADFLKDYLPADQYKKLHDLVAAVPEDNHMLHGDYHVKNVMLQNGEALLIDMDTLCHGHPVFELASMYNAYCGYSELDPSISQTFLGIPHDVAVEFWNHSLHMYLDNADEETCKAVEDKAKVIGYTRIMRRRIRRKGFESEEGKREIENCAAHLAELLPRIDTLLF